MKNIALVILVAVLAAGCTGQPAGQAVPAATTGTPGPVITTAAAEVTQEILPATTSEYCYEKNGKYGRQPPNFVCLESNPTYIYGPDGFVCKWCDRGQLVK